MEAGVLTTQPHLLPDGGPILDEAEPYFSPAFSWTRIATDSRELDLDLKRP